MMNLPLPPSLEPPTGEPPAAVLPLDPQFQSRLLLQLSQDAPFAAAAMPHLRPEYFENDIEFWAFAAMQRYHASYGHAPPWGILLQHLDEIERIDRRANYEAWLRDLGTWAPLPGHAAQYLQDKVLGFCRRRHVETMLARASRLQHDREFDVMVELCEQTALKMPPKRFVPADREDLYEDFSERSRRRRALDRESHFITTGLPTLDRILGGGLSKGRLGLWLAYPKIGKSMLLTALGTFAARAGRRVLHMIYEGSMDETLDRYDAAHSGVLQQLCGRDELPPERRNRLTLEYAEAQGSVRLRAFTRPEDNAWACSVMTIQDELSYQKQTSGWVPDLIVVDYVDLMTGRDKSYRNTTERQLAACQDIKTLANQGYAVWTACQPQRPEEDAEIKPHVLRGRNVADCFGKIRAADFVGSINITSLEKQHKVARLFAEMYRGQEADQEWAVRFNHGTVQIREEPGLKSPHLEIQDDSTTATLTPGRGGRRGDGAQQTRAF